MKILIIGMTLLTSLPSFAGFFEADREVIVNGKTEIYISAENSDKLFNKCTLLTAHLYRGFVALGQDKMEMDTRVFEVKHVTNDKNRVLQSSGICTVTWEESDSNVVHDGYVESIDGKFVKFSHPKLVKD